MKSSNANAKQRSLGTYHVHQHLDGNIRILVNVVLALQRERLSSLQSNWHFTVSIGDLQMGSDRPIIPATRG